MWKHTESQGVHTALSFFQPRLGCSLPAVSHLVPVLHIVRRLDDHCGGSADQSAAA